MAVPLYAEILNIPDARVARTPFVEYNVIYNAILTRESRMEDLSHGSLPGGESALSGN